MNAAEIKALRLQTIADFKRQRAEKQRVLDSLRNTLLGQGWIVVAEGDVSLTFTVDGRTVTQPVPAGGAEKAMRFTQEDARRVASQVANGRGAVAGAIHVTEALQNEISETTRLIDWLQRLNNGS